MANLFLGAFLLGAQLVASGTGALPEVVTADYPSSEVAAGRDAAVTLSLNVRDGYLINHTPPMQLKLQTVPGVTLVQSTLTSPALDPDSTDAYYVNVPDFTIGVTAQRAGTYTVPGELVYFFCSKADGFCARQTLNVSVPVVAE
jgi:hypothetical protein